ncbi:hypothetical protein ACA910_010937 [Epithemia clementina (nom. ined.)]
MMSSSSSSKTVTAATVLPGSNGTATTTSTTTLRITSSVIRTSAVSTSSAAAAGSSSSSSLVETKPKDPMTPPNSKTTLLELVNPQQSTQQAEPPVVVVVVPPPVPPPPFQWHNSYNLVHVVHTRFMQHQPNLTHLGRARLDLFQTMTWPSMVQQSTQEFLWMIRTDPQLDAALLADLVHVIIRQPLSSNVVLIASNVNDNDIRHNISDVTPRTVLAGSYELVQSYHQAAQTRVVLETRLDADDALSCHFLETVQSTVAAAMNTTVVAAAAATTNKGVHDENGQSLLSRRVTSPTEDSKEPAQQQHKVHHDSSSLSSPSSFTSSSSSWMVLCLVQSLEWQMVNPWNEKSREGSLSLSSSSKFCLTPGLTIAFQIHATMSHLPVINHAQMTASRFPSCQHNHKKKNKNSNKKRKTTTATSTTKKTTTMSMNGCRLTLTFNESQTAALRARTPTSAGMKNIVVRNASWNESSSSRTGRHSSHHRPTGRFEQVYFHRQAWSRLSTSFGLHGHDALVQLKQRLEANLPALLAEARQGQCTKSHSCKSSALEKLKQWLHQVVVASSSSSVVSSVVAVPHNQSLLSSSWPNNNNSSNSKNTTANTHRSEFFVSAAAASNDFERAATSARQQPQQHVGDSTLVPQTFTLTPIHIPPVQPFWNCSNNSHGGAAGRQVWNNNNNNNNNRKVLIFVHVFKTAGTTLREFWKEYGQHCQVGVASISSCSNVAVASLLHSNINGPPDSFWSDDQGLPCLLSLQESVFYHGPSQSFQTPNTTKQVRVNFDLLKNHIHANIWMGHFPIGLHEYYNSNGREGYDDDEAAFTAMNHSIRDENRNTKTINNKDDMIDTALIPQYVTFFREPLHRYVSSVLYVNRNKNWTRDYDLAMAELQRRIQTTEASADKPQEYLVRYAPYLLTPQQKEELRQSNASSPAAAAEQQVQLIQQNLIRYQVLIGIVEHMDDSMALIEYVVDGTYEFADGFARFRTNRWTNNNNNSSIPNQHSSKDNDKGTTADTTNATAREKEDVTDNTTPSSSTPISSTKGGSGAEDGRVILNSSRLSTSQLVQRLLRDHFDFAVQAREYLKYEYELYHFALRIHQAQLASILPKGGGEGRPNPSH